MGVGSPLLPRQSWGWNANCQAWQQAPFLAEPFRWSGGLKIAVKSWLDMTGEDYAVSQPVGGVSSHAVLQQQAQHGFP